MKKITGHTRLIGLLGHPIRHSKSPEMHNAAFQDQNLDYVYLVFDIREDQLEEAVQATKIMDLVGFNVTMPHKQKVMKYLDDISEEARFMGAVNTVKNDRGRLIGYNTDGKGFTNHLRSLGYKIEGQKYCVIGAGGAATSIAVQLAMDGAAEICIFNRTVDRAKGLMNLLKNHFPYLKIKALPLEMDLLQVESENATALINSTGVGMGALKDQTPVTDERVFHPRLLVYDVIYAPPKTLLLTMAEDAGCNVENGLGMMLYQGALAYELWTGKTMPIEKVKVALEMLEK